jgi:hypothetical protein
MRTHRTMALAATLSLAAVAAMTDMPPGTVAAHADVAASRPRPSAGSAALAALRSCESGGDYTSDTGNGYYGAYQFARGTWASLGYRGRPDQAPPAVQDQAAARLQSITGWSSWPACAARLGLRSGRVRTSDLAAQAVPSTARQDGPPPPPPVAVNPPPPPPDLSSLNTLD